MSKEHSWGNVFRDISLTERELEVLRLKAKRHTNAEIAAQLIISLTTVKWYVRQIYNKLGVTNRVEMVKAAHQLGLLAKIPGDRQVPRYNLPLPATPFIGRTAEIQHLSRLITAPEIRLFTLTGPGGIGKTRLALQLANNLNNHFPGGICWVSFAAQDSDEILLATAGETIIATIMAVLGLIPQAGESPLQALEGYLQQREMLIILDTFEHLTAGAPVIAALLANSPSTKFLVTSRERLYLSGEQIYAVSALALSKDMDQGAELADAEKLFLDAAGRVSTIDPGTPTTRGVIRRICARLEGMPLAIELAADWTRLLSLTEIEQELASSLNFLDARTTSMREAITRSWNLLTEGQRAAFARLSIFQSGFTRQAAHDIAGADLNILAALFDKSLIQISRNGRYTMHDLLRQFAAEQLQMRGELQAVRDAHCAFFAHMAASQLESIYCGDHRVMVSDLDNIRAAWRWAVEHDRFENLHQMLVPLAWIYNMRANYAEGAAAVRLLLKRVQTADPQGLQGILYGLALVDTGLQQSRLLGAGAVEPQTREGLAILRRLGAREAFAWYQVLAILYGIIGHQAKEGETLCLESLAIFEAVQNPTGSAYALAILGSHYRKLGRYEKAFSCIQQSRDISRAHGNRQGTAVALHHLGDLNLHFGNYDAALANFQEEARLWQELALSRLAGEASRSLGQTLLAAGKLDEAESVLSQSLADFEALRDQGNAALSLLDLAQIACIRGRLRAAVALLADAELILAQRSDDQEHARFWQLSGRLFLLQGAKQKALEAYGYALDHSLQAGPFSLFETLLGFAYLAKELEDHETAVTLLGFLSVQDGLPAPLSRNCIDSLHQSLTAALKDKTLSEHLQKGANLDRDAVINLIRTQTASFAN